jgi:hypothetical protein
VLTFELAPEKHHQNFRWCFRGEGRNVNTALSISTKKRRIKMNDQQKMGGVSALIMAGTWVVGMVLLFTLLAPFGTGDEDPAFLADNQAIIYIWNLIIYLVFGVFLVVLALALFERLKAGSPAMVQTATVYGI